MTNIIVVFSTIFSMSQFLYVLLCLLSGRSARLLDRGGSNRKGLQLRKGGGHCSKVLSAASAESRILEKYKVLRNV